MQWYFDNYHFHFSYPLLSYDFFQTRIDIITARIKITTQNPIRESYSFLYMVGTIKNPLIGKDNKAISKKRHTILATIIGREIITLNGFIFVILSFTVVY